MKKLTALFVASTLALGAASVAHAADTTTSTTTEAAQPNGKMMQHHKGSYGPTPRHDVPGV
ncbi:Spheroplast protein Y precursor [Kluyvera intermedia]|nr:Spheroplast protein Y precursor [Kluyvera intermedia]